MMAKQQIITKFPKGLPQYPLYGNFSEDGNYLKISYILTGKQFEILNDFYLKTWAKYETFEFVHPRTQEDIICEFSYPPTPELLGMDTYKIEIKLLIKENK